MAPELMSEDKAADLKKVERKEQEKGQAPGSVSEGPAMRSLQQRIGNRAVQRVLAQRSGDGSFALDDATASRIRAMRGGGQSLERNVEKSLGKSMNADFSGVKVHTSSEADQVSRDLGARAFTTGSDVFFREGVYNPHTSGGQKTIAHELTHVVQQGSGAGGGVGRMTVGAPHDAYEQEADSVANSIVGSGLQAQPQAQREEDAVRRQVEEEEPLQTQAEEEEDVQMQTEEEDETCLTPGEKIASGGMGRGLATGGGQGPLGVPLGVKEEELQMQVEPEEEEEVQMQAEEEEEEEEIQTQAAEEEEEVVGA